jgi:hypothetical protein
MQTGANRFLMSSKVCVAELACMHLQQNGHPPGNAHVIATTCSTSNVQQQQEQVSACMMPFWQPVEERL